jgi:MFS family permease
MSIRANLRKIYIYKFLSEFYLIVQASYALAVLLLEVPSGYLSDRIGRKHTLILGALFFPIGIGVYMLGSVIWHFILAEIFIAGANSMRSGCDSALIYDTLLMMKQESEYKKYVCLLSPGRPPCPHFTGTAVSGQPHFRLGDAARCSCSYRTGAAKASGRPSFPLVLDHINRDITSDIRATVISVSYMSGSVLYVLMAPLFGHLVDRTSLSAAFFSLGAFFLAAAVLLLLTWQKLRRQDR